MPLIVQTGKQRILQGLPLPIVCYAVGESRKRLQELSGVAPRLRSISDSESDRRDVQRDNEPWLDYDDFGDATLWSVIDTSGLPPGLYAAEVDRESASISTPISAVLDEESYKHLLEEENDEEFDETSRIRADDDSLMTFAKQVIASQPVISAFRSAALLRRIPRYSEEIPVIFSNWSRTSRPIGFVSEARLRYGIEAFLSDLMYFVPFPSPSFGFYPRRANRLFDLHAGFHLSEQNDVLISATLTLPFPVSSVVETFPRHADIVWLERFHPEIFRAVVKIEKDGAVELQLTVSSRR